jgi:hypothetical protein
MVPMAERLGWFAQMAVSGNTMILFGPNLNTAPKLSALKKDYNMNTDNDISFEEFVELCSEAGISTDNLEQMEQDFRAGRALADVTDALITDQETHPAPYAPGEHLESMDVTLTMLEEGGTTEGNKKAAVKLAVQALRYLAECCHDEGKN